MPPSRCRDAAPRSAVGLGQTPVVEDERPGGEVAGATGGRRWFEAVADHLGAAYLRYSFTYGTEQEVAFLLEASGLEPPATVVDVGCGPGRHARALAARGFTVVGVDLSARFLALARARGGAAYVRADAAALPLAPGSADLVVSLCQGGFGLLAGPTPLAPPDPDPDGAALAEMARALRPGGLLAASAFSAYFQVRHLEDQDRFDASRGVNHERTEIRSEAGEVAPAELWTSCFTPRELRLLAADAGLEVVGLWSVTPGDYAARPPSVDRPELLLLARRPRAAASRPSSGSASAGC